MEGTVPLPLRGADAPAAVDPVCGMRVEPGPGALALRHAGVEHWFCSAHCRERFRADPQAFLRGPAREADAGAPAGAAAPKRGDYTPLVVVLLLILAATAVASWRDAAAGRFTGAGAVAGFMAGFFLVFAGFKLMDLRGFAEGYATYDLLAQRLPAYGYVYPFVELAFGLLMLGGLHPPWLLWTEAGVMAFSGLGVGVKLARGERFPCACLGTFLKVPLTKVTLVEDFGMAALALALLAL